MADPFIGEIRMFAGTYAPRNWALCDGQLIPISDFQMLYSLLGTNYGGDGCSTFGLPDMRGRIPVHFGQGDGLSYRAIGMKPGRERQFLSLSQIPLHNHTMQASARQASASSGDSSTPTGNVTASSDELFYHSEENSPQIAAFPDVVEDTGDNIPHYNMMPALAINFIISLKGRYPERN